MARDLQDKLMERHRKGEVTAYGINKQPLDRESEEPAITGAPTDDKEKPSSAIDTLSRMESQTPEQFEAELDKDIEAIRQAGYEIDDETTEDEEIFEEMREFDKPQTKKTTPTRQQIKEAKIGTVVQQAAIDYAKSKGVNLDNQAEADVFWANCSRVNPNISLIEQIHEATSKTLRALGRSIPHDKAVTMEFLLNKDKEKMKYAGPSAQNTTKKEEGEQPATLDNVLTKIQKKQVM